MKVVICGPNLFDQSKGQFHVHKKGCADLRKREYRAVAPHMPAEVKTKLDVATFVYEDIMRENEGVLATPEPYVSEFHFAPCVRGLK
jgi:hypothetical protein